MDSNVLEKIYVIQFPDGTYAKGDSWNRADSPLKAKIYPSRANANRATGYHKWKDAVVKVFVVTEEVEA